MSRLLFSITSELLSAARAYLIFVSDIRSCAAQDCSRFERHQSMTDIVRCEQRRQVYATCRSFAARTRRDGHLTRAVNAGPSPLDSSSRSADGVSAAALFRLRYAFIC